MALIFPPTDDPVELKAIQVIRAIEQQQPIYGGAQTVGWFRLLMDQAMRPGADLPVYRCALRLIVTYAPYTDRGLIWVLFVFLNCTVPSSWGSALRSLYINLESAMRGLYGFATGSPQPTVDQLAARTRSDFNRFMSLPPPTPSLTLIDLAPVRKGYVALRDWLTGR